MKPLTQERLKELLHYDPSTGLFTWVKPQSNRVLIGDRAGSYHKASGYIHVGINGRKYRAHRLAVLYMKGYLPEYSVDHKDKVRHHNWFDNLREASQQCQLRNAGMLCNNTSGIKGVHWYKSIGKWYAIIKLNGRSRFLGYYVERIEAVYARYAAEQCLGFPDCDNASSAKCYIEACR